jgi:hypothetical protein
MQVSTYYKSTTNNVYGWQAYPATQRAPFICEVGQMAVTAQARPTIGLVFIIALVVSCNAATCCTGGSGQLPPTLTPTPPYRRLLLLCRNR